jgi:hypothetical protein
VIGDDYVKLLLVDYSFHLSLMVSAVIIARFFLATIRQAGAASPRPERAVAATVARASR